MGDAASRNRSTSSAVSLPRPTSTRTPTIRRTIFHTKCDPVTRTRIRSPSSLSSSDPSCTSVDISSGSLSVNDRKSCTVSYTHLRAHETRHDLVCRLLLEKKKKKQKE